MAGLTNAVPLAVQINLPTTKHQEPVSMHKGVERDGRGPTSVGLVALFVKFFQNYSSYPAVLVDEIDESFIVPRARTPVSSANGLPLSVLHISRHEPQGRCDPILGHLVFGTVKGSIWGFAGDFGDFLEKSRKFGWIFLDFWEGVCFEGSSLVCLTMPNMGAIVAQSWSEGTI